MFCFVSFFYFLFNGRQGIIKWAVLDFHELQAGDGNIWKKVHGDF